MFSAIKWFVPTTGIRDAWAPRARARPMTKWFWIWRRSGRNALSNAPDPQVVSTAHRWPGYVVGMERMRKIVTPPPSLSV
jgi:hypothetical protein